MIVSASRRTDIPAFYGEWFRRRLDAGFCETVNPFNPTQRSKVLLDPELVDAFVFWTRYPISLLPLLADMDARGHRYYFLYTLLDYPAEIDRRSPPFEKRLDLFNRVADHVGPDRIIWRYDPIFRSRIVDSDYHRTRFTEIARRVGSRTNRVIVSLLDRYGKAERRFGNLPEEHRPFDLGATELADLVGDLKSCAAAEGISMQSCAGELYAGFAALPPGACIDADMVASLTGRSRSEFPQAKNQRPACRCAESRDIGSYDTCMFDCVYCYACRSIGRSRANFRRHDPSSPVLVAPP